MRPYILLRHPRIGPQYRRASRAWRAEKNMNPEKLILDVVAGLLVALLSLVGKAQWPLIRNLFDDESRRQAKQISGTWKATEVFHDSRSQNTYTMHVKCRGGQITGTHVCLTGPDAGKTFDLRGTYKDRVLTFAWTPSSREELESGTVTAILDQDRHLAGHGLYIEPADGKVHTSTYTATR
jgi:hypothetical protein